MLVVDVVTSALAVADAILTQANDAATVSEDTEELAKRVRTLSSLLQSIRDGGEIQETQAAHEALASLRERLEHAHELVCRVKRLGRGGIFVRASRLASEFASVKEGLEHSLNALSVVTVGDTQSIRTNLTDLQQQMRDWTIANSKSSDEVKSLVQSQNNDIMGQLNKISSCLSSLMEERNARITHSQVGELEREAERMKQLNEDEEEKFLKQLCAALSKSAVDDNPSGTYEAEAEMPPRFYCPITFEPMLDPVLTESGTGPYERDAILRWWEEHPRQDPVTNEVLSSSALISQHNMRSDIYEFFHSRGHKDFGLAHGELQERENKERERRRKEAEERDEKVRRQERRKLLEKQREHQQQQQQQSESQHDLEEQESEKVNQENQGHEQHEEENLHHMPSPHLHSRAASEEEPSLFVRRARENVRHRSQQLAKQQDNQLVIGAVDQLTKPDDTEGVLALEGSSLKGTELSPICMAIPVAPHITTVNLQGCDIGRDGCQKLGEEALKSQFLTRLSLDRTNIDDEASRHLAAGLKNYNSALRELSLALNKLGDNAVLHLADVLAHTTLQSLSLNMNDRIGDAGVQSLARVLPYTSLEHLGLAGTSAGDHAAHALSQALAHSPALTSLNLGLCKYVSEEYGCTYFLHYLSTGYYDHLQKLNLQAKSGYQGPVRQALNSRYSHRVRC